MQKQKMINGRDYILVIASDLSTQKKRQSSEMNMGGGGAQMPKVQKLLSRKMILTRIIIFYI